MPAGTLASKGSGGCIVAYRSSLPRKSRPAHPHRHTSGRTVPRDCRGYVRLSAVPAMRRRPCKTIKVLPSIQGEATRGRTGGLNRTRNVCVPRSLCKRCSGFTKITFNTQTRAERVMKSPPAARSAGFLRCHLVNVHNPVGTATEYHECGNAPQQKNRHGVLPWLFSRPIQHMIAGKVA